MAPGGAATPIRALPQQGGENFNPLAVLVGGGHFS
jgi:hypothetical protein